MVTIFPPLYPLLFDEIYKTTLWGGDKIYQYKGEKPPCHSIGETWEISPLEGNISVISNGFLRGKNLNEVALEYGEKLLGREVMERYEGQFPLLVKLIDAQSDLSVQVHPSDAYAQEKGIGWGKTEMWYLLSNTPDARIRFGWTKETDPCQLRELVKSDAVMEYIGSYKSHPGDVFYISPGKVHTIGAGNLLLEIQQASNTTYRLYDFNRTDADGNKRPLHIEQAMEVIDYGVNNGGTLTYDRTLTDTPITLVDCPYFTTRLLQLTKSYHCNLEPRQSFTILFVEDGEVILNDELPLRRGQITLIPACIKEISIALSSPKAKLVEAYIR